MNLRMRLALIAIGSVCAAFVATEWLNYPRETWIRWIASFGIWSGVALVFAGAVDRAVTLPLQRLQLFALRLGKEPDPPKPQFRDTEWSELAERSRIRITRQDRASNIFRSCDAQCASCKGICRRHNATSRCVQTAQHSAPDSGDQEPGPYVEPAQGGRDRALRAAKRSGAAVSVPPLQRMPCFSIR